MKKSFITLLTLVVGVELMLAYNDHATYVDGIYYDLDNNKQTAAVSFPGSIPTGGAYRGDIVIPSSVAYDGITYSVTSIGSSAFKNCENVSSVTIPNTVTIIEEEAFAECRYLRPISIPNSVTTIKDRAFYHCTFCLTSITIPNSVTSIGEEAFSQCGSLVSAAIGTGLINIGKKAFYGSNLKELVMYSPIPPTIINDSLEIAKPYMGYPIFPKSVVIYIPCGSFEAYSESNWRFYNVQYSAEVYNNFEIDVESSDSLKGSVVVDLEYDNSCNTLLKIIAMSNYGYKFTQWSDGNTENPRTLVLDKNTSLMAEFDITKRGTCGKNDQLSWAYDDKTKTLKIEGSGELIENYTYGLEAPTQMQNLIIGNEVIAIGDSAFYAKTTMRHLSLGSNITSIGNYAFAECKNYDDITCHAMTVPTITATSFANIGNKYYIYLYVPEGCQRAYRRDTYWSAFDIRPIVEATGVETDDIKVTSTDSSAVVSWPSITGAATYELVIKDKNGNIVCTLIFNAQGMLLQISFNAPARRNASQQAQANGFSFVVTGLDEGTTYDLVITAKDIDNNTIEEKTISFTTTGDDQGIENVLNNSSAKKIIENNNIYILMPNGNKYSIIGDLIN